MLEPIIINTEKTDLHFIYWLFDEAIAYQQRNQYPVWPAYDKNVLAKDIEQKHQFKILIDSAIACIFSISYSDQIVWRERDRGQAIYLHRVVVNPQFKGRKLFKKVLAWGIQNAVKKELTFVRMDTWADNPTIIEYYQSFRFKIIDYYTTPNTPELPIQQRNNDIVLLEYKIQ